VRRRETLDDRRKKKLESGEEEEAKHRTSWKGKETKQCHNPSDAVLLYIGRTWRSY